MRNFVEGPCLALRAIAGAYVVTLAWDFRPDQDANKKALLGFAIERTQFNAAGNAVERYWLRGIKRFMKKDEGLAPGTPVPTSEHPVQTFQWGDYTPAPGVTYEYRVVPVYGKPKLLTLGEDRATTVRVTTELERGEPAAGETGHDIYFNRGVAGSQAYARKFGKTKPDPDKPASAQMKWLSRGLFEALTGFIGLAAGADAASYKLRAMLYEFRYPPVGKALKAAADAGADVAVRYEAQSYVDENETMIHDLGIGGFCKPQAVRAGVRHNKFIVLIRNNKPVAVWTGSTNISAGGIFGHSNVGHVVWDATIAKRYLAYWTDLAKDLVDVGELKKTNNKVEPTPAAKPPTGEVLTLFSPRDPSTKKAPTLDWYGKLLGSAEKIACMTFAFNFDEVFEKAVEGDTDSLNYLLFDKALAAGVEAKVAQTGNTVIAVGAKLNAGDLENFIGEDLTGFNTNRYIHDKFLLVDPLTADPIVVSGTANFSRASQATNDENMLVIRGDLRVADIYFGEFMRIFDHLYSRYIVAKIKAQGTSNPKAGYLKDTAAEWLPAHFQADSVKDRRRRYFMAGA